MTKNEILQLSGAALDAAVAEFMPGWEAKEGRAMRPIGNCMWSILHPSSDLNAVREMEEELERRGLAKSYMTHLIRLLPPFHNGDFGIRLAPADLCCKAALLAVAEMEALK